MDKKIFALFVVMTMVMLVSNVSADVGYFCINNNSFHNWTIGDGSTTTIYNMTTPCKYGCDVNTGQCYDEPTGNGIDAMAVGIGILMIALFYLAVTSKDKPFQYLFLLLGFFVGIIEAGLLREIAVLNNQITIERILSTFYSLWTNMTTFVMFIIIILIIYEYGRWIIDLAKKFYNSMRR